MKTADFFVLNPVSESQKNKQIFNQILLESTGSVLTTHHNSVYRFNSLAPGRS